MSSAEKLCASLCQEIGRKVPTWTQGAGGNISIKDQDQLWIKSSGLRLDQVTESSGLIRMRLKDFRERLKQISDSKLGDDESEKRYAEAVGNSAEKGQSVGRPSMEAGFHAVLRRKYVAHFHSLAAILMSDMQEKNPEQFKSWVKLFPKLSVQFVPAVQPGWNLSDAISEVQERSGEADILILANHGVILNFDDPRFLEDWKLFELSFCEKMGFLKLRDLLQAQDDLEELRTKLPPAPFKIYFPDAAVFAARIQKVLTAEGAGTVPFWKLAESSGCQDLAATEIWIATQILFECLPTLSEFPAELSAALGALPTEVLRKQAMSQFSGAKRGKSNHAF